MDRTIQTISIGRRRIGRILSGFAVLFMLFDSITKILKVDAVVVWAGIFLREPRLAALVPFRTGKQRPLNETQTVQHRENFSQSMTYAIKEEVQQ